MIRQNRVKVFLLTVVCLVAAVTFAGTVLALLKDEPLDMTPLYACLVLVFLCGLSVSVSYDRYRAELIAVAIRVLRRKTMEEITMFSELVGKEILAVMATGGSVRGRVECVEGGWMKVVNKRGENLVNVELVSTATVLPEKKAKAEPAQNE